MNISDYFVHSVESKIDYLEILATTLHNYVPRELYSIGCYREEAFCIEKQEPSWIVYIGERGNKHNVKSFNDAFAACFELISRVSESDEQERKLRCLFYLYAINNKRFSLVQSKRYGNNLSFSKLDAITMIKYGAVTKMDNLIEVHVSTGCDRRHVDQQVNGTVVLPYSIGTRCKVLVFARDNKIVEAKIAGADYVGGEEFVSKIKEDGWFDFDVVVATPDMMGVVSRLGRILGPKGLMPSPKAGTVTMDVTRAVQEIKAGKIEYKLDKCNIVHVPVGKASFTEEALQQNFDALMEAIVKAKPKNVKEQYIKNVTLSSAEGLSVMVDLKTIGAGH